MKPTAPRLRNVTKGGWFIDEWEPQTAREIHASDRGAWTGLYNHIGEPLHRQDEPFGFQPPHDNEKR